MSDLPARIIVGANGAYWLDYGDHYAMPPVSEDNDPVVPAAIYVLIDVDTLARALPGVLDQAECEAIYGPGQDPLDQAQEWFMSPRELAGLLLKGST